MYVNVNINVFFVLIKVQLLVNELYKYQNAQCSDKKYSSSVCTTLKITAIYKTWKPKRNCRFRDETTRNAWHQHGAELYTQTHPNTGS